MRMPVSHQSAPGVIVEHLLILIMYLKKTFKKTVISDNIVLIKYKAKHVHTKLYFVHLIAFNIHINYILIANNMNL